jgi:hypothetical protein
MLRDASYNIRIECLISGIELLHEGMKHGFRKTVQHILRMKIFFDHFSTSAVMIQHICFVPMFFHLSFDVRLHTVNFAAKKMERKIII